MRTRRLAALLVTSLPWLSAPAAAAQTDVVPTQTTLAQVIALHAKAQTPPGAAFASRRERYTIRTGTQTSTLEIAWRGADFAERMTFGQFVAAEGRRGGTRWARDENGFVRTLSDPQDQEEFDAAVRPAEIDAQHDRLAGETPDHTAYVVEHGEQPQLRRWFIDERTGQIVKVVDVYGRFTTTTALSDFRAVGGTTRAFHAVVTAGVRGLPQVDVTLDDVQPARVSDADLAIPASRPPLIDASHGPVSIPARVLADTFVVVRLTASGGRGLDFVVDSGTPALAFNNDVAAQLHYTTYAGRAVAQSLRLGDAPLDGVVLRTDRFAEDVAPDTKAVGILGFDFFMGNVVRVDYAGQRVELFDRRTFRPPAGATRIPITVDEGWPLAPATIDGVSSSRFLLDTASPVVVVMRRFSQAHPEAVADDGKGGGAPQVLAYAAGARVAHRTELRSFAFGPVDYRNVTLAVQRKDDAGVTAPFDGIIGSQLLRRFDLYFDYAGGAAYVVPASTGG